MVVVPYQDGAEVGSNPLSHSLSCSLNPTRIPVFPASPSAAFPAHGVGIRVAHHPLSLCRARRRIAALAR